MEHFGHYQLAKQYIGSIYCKGVTHHLLLTGFAINLQLLLAHPDAHIDPGAQRGYLESSLLDKLVTLEELEPKAKDCTKVT